ncbi:MAG: T9SS type A sorting domain-containing protein [Dysgonamonadaceae bacterium]|jgi:hypothetical protein|nr:T9SS type A sorting domain-containing protein [Dysgonamonadaceae bacterium]
MKTFKTFKTNTLILVLVFLGLYCFSGSVFGHPEHQENVIAASDAVFRIVADSADNATIRLYTSRECSADREIPSGILLPKGTAVYILVSVDPDYVLNAIVINSVPWLDRTLPVILDENKIVRVVVEKKPLFPSYGVYGRSENLNIHNNIVYDNLYTGYSYNLPPDATNLLNTDPKFVDPSGDNFRQFPVNTSVFEVFRQGLRSHNPLKTDIIGTTFLPDAYQIISGAYQALPLKSVRVRYINPDHGTFRLSIVDPGGRELSTIRSKDTLLVQGTLLKIVLVPENGYRLSEPIKLGGSRTLESVLSITPSIPISSKAGIKTETEEFLNGGVEYLLSGTIKLSNITMLDVSAVLSNITKPSTSSTVYFSGEATTKNNIVYDNLSVSGISSESNLTLIDPVFDESNSGDSFLQFNATAEAVFNSGDNAANPLKVDLSGKPRISGYGIDMGAYENRSFAKLIFEKVFDERNVEIYVDMQVTNDNNPREIIVSNVVLTGESYLFRPDFDSEKIDKTEGALAYDVKVNGFALNNDKGISNLNNKSWRQVLAEGGKATFEPFADEMTITYKVSPRRLHYTPEYSKYAATVRVKNVANDAIVSYNYGSLAGVSNLKIEVDIKDASYQVDYVLLNDKKIDISSGSIPVPDLIINELSVVFKPVDFEVHLKATGGTLDVVNLKHSTSISDGSKIPFGTHLRVTASPFPGYTQQRLTVNGQSIENGAEIVISENTFIELDCAEPSLSVIRYKADHATILVTNTDAANAPVGSGDKLSVGTNLKVVVTPDAGYELKFIEAYGKDLSDNGTKSEVAVVSQRTSDAYDIIASTRKIGNYRMTIVQPKIGGTITVTNKVTGQLVANNAEIAAGTEIRVTLTPDAGYSFGNLSVNGASIENNGLHWVNEDVEITGYVNISAFYLLTIEQVGKGTVEVKDGINSLTDGSYVSSGANLAITATPNSGTAFIFVNDKPFISGSSHKVTGNTTVRVYFTSSGKYPVGLKAENGTFTVTNVSEGNAVIKDGDEVASGTVLNVIFTPKKGYEQTSLTLNGVDFSASNLTVTNAGVFLHGIAKLNKYDVSGTVSGLDNNSGLTITYSINDGAPQTTTTGVDGLYSIAVPPGMTVAIYPPEISGKQSNPQSYTGLVVNENKTGLDFVYSDQFIPIKILKDLEDAIICIGEEHTFEIIAEGENLTYEWYYGNSLITGANTNRYTVTAAILSDYERYYVIVRSIQGSYRTSVYSKNVRLWVAEYLPKTLEFVSCPARAVTGETYLIKLAGYPDITQYSWSYRKAESTSGSNDDVTFSPSVGGVGKNETLATFGTLSVGTGTLTVSLVHPCGLREASQTIVVNYPTGTTDVASDAVRVYPNPASGIVNVTNTHSNSFIRVTGATGSQTRTYPAQEGITTIDLTGYAKGMYLLHYNGKAYKVILK